MVVVMREGLLTAARKGREMVGAWCANVATQCGNVQAGARFGERQSIKDVVYFGVLVLCFWRTRL